MIWVADCEKSPPYPHPHALTHTSRHTNQMNFKIKTMLFIQYFLSAVFLVMKIAVKMFIRSAHKFAIQIVYSDNHIFLLRVPFFRVTRFYEVWFNLILSRQKKKEPPAPYPISKPSHSYTHNYDFVQFQFCTIFLSNCDTLSAITSEVLFAVCNVYSNWMIERGPMHDEPLLCAYLLFTFQSPIFYYFHCSVRHFHSFESHTKTDGCLLSRRLEDTWEVNRIYVTLNRIECKCQ